MIITDAFSASSMSGCRSWRRRVRQSMCLVACLSVLRLDCMGVCEMIAWVKWFKKLSQCWKRAGEHNHHHCQDMIHYNYIPFFVPQMELPFYSKFLLIAAYLASYNPARTDRRFFMKHHGKQRKTKAMIKVLTLLVDNSYIWNWFPHKLLHLYTPYLYASCRRMVFVHAINMVEWYNNNMLFYML